MQGGTFEITVNGRRFDAGDGVRPRMTAGEIAALVGIPSANALIERETGRRVYEEVARGATLDVRDRMHFLVTREFVMGG